jgi:hypothetical protein
VVWFHAPGRPPRSTTDIDRWPPHVGDLPEDDLDVVMFAQTFLERLRTRDEVNCCSWRPDLEEAKHKYPEMPDPIFT